MRWFLIVVSLAIGIGCCSSAVASAGIRLENEGTETLYVFLQGVNEKGWWGPYLVPPRGKVDLVVAPGKYRVATQHPDKRFDYLNWQDYSDPKITYRISLCAACGPPGQKVPRLGVCIIDGQNGVLVTEVLANSPSRKLHPGGGDTSKNLSLVAGKAIITSVNGKPTPNTSEFLKVVAESPVRIELTVSDLQGKIVEKYWTQLEK